VPLKAVEKMACRALRSWCYEDGCLVLVSESPCHCCVKRSECAKDVCSGFVKEGRKF